MINPVLLVFTNPTPGQDAEYNEWYTQTHLPELLEIPGVVAAQRWKVSEHSMASPAHSYLAIYELDERPATDVIASLIEAAPSMSMSPSLGDALMVLYEPLTERILEVARLEK